MTHIILAEPNAMIERLLTPYLLGAGYTVTSVSDGSDLVACALAFIPDGIVCQHDLPECSGTMACQILRQHRLTVHVPLLLLSSQPAVLADAPRVGVTATLQTPFHPEDLRNTLVTMLSAAPTP